MAGRTPTRSPMGGKGPMPGNTTFMDTFQPPPGADYSSTRVPPGGNPAAFQVSMNPGPGMPTPYAAYGAQFGAMAPAGVPSAMNGLQPYPPPPMQAPQGRQGPPPGYGPPPATAMPQFPGAPSITPQAMPMGMGQAPPPGMGNLPMMGNAASMMPAWGMQARPTPPPFTLPQITPNGRGGVRGQQGGRPNMGGVMGQLTMQQPQQFGQLPGMPGRRGI